MTQEEKARRYDEALERARELSNSISGAQYDTIFPELKESEDEKIKKAVIDAVETLSDSPLKVKMLTWLEAQSEQNLILPKWKYKKDNTPLLRDSIILNKYGCVAKSPSGALVSDVWVIDYAELAKLPKEEIEKQGEQKPVIEMKTPEESLGIDSNTYNKIVDECIYGENKSTDKVEPMFRVGDEIKTSNEESLTITKIDEKGYWSKDLFICGFDDAAKWELVEQKPYGQRQECIDCQFNYAGDCKCSCGIKQCEHKQKVQPKFNVGEWVVFNDRHGSVYQIEKIENFQYTLRHILGGSMPLSFSHEDMIRIWTIQDAKSGDMLEFGDHGRLVVGIVSYVNKTTGKVDVNCLLENSNFKVGNYYNLDTIKPHPATKEQRDTLMKAMADAGWKFDFEKKELKKIEQKSAWSEEDEKQARQIERIVHDDGCSQKLQKQIADWFKSLKDRAQPKQDLDFRYPFYLGKADICVDLLKHFEPLEP